MNKIFFILFGLFSLILVAQEEKNNQLFLPIGSSLQESNMAKYALDSVQIFKEVDSIITNGIKNKAFPGAQILVAKEGNIIFHNAYSPYS